MLRASKGFDNPKSNISGKNIHKAYMTGKIETPTSWIIDSGASDHITHHKDWLKDIRTNQNNNYVTITNGTSISIKNTNNIRLTDRFNLKDVLNVPSFNCNLIFVSRLLNDLTCSITFYPKTCYI